MEHADHLNFLRLALQGKSGVWADFGCGRGAFTLALADLIGPGSQIYAIDKDQRALQELESEMHHRFPFIHLKTILHDYTQTIELPSLDGLVAANTLHFHKQPLPVLRRLCGYLRPGGCFLLVEYNITHGNLAVPYPIPYVRWEKLAGQAGLGQTRLLHTRPSRFLHQIYSAASWLAPIDNHA